MPKEVIMPALGMAQDEGILLRWLKKEGEMVQAGEPLMEVATDKVDVQVEAPASGVLTAVTAQEGDEIPVGQVIGLIAAEGEELPRPFYAGAGSRQDGWTGCLPVTREPRPPAQSPRALPRNTASICQRCRLSEGASPKKTWRLIFAP